MSGGPVKIPGKPLAASLTVREVVDAVMSYLQAQGFETGAFDFEELSEQGCSIGLHRVVENGTPWEGGRFLFFDITHTRLRNMDSRVGRGPFSITIKRSRLIEEGGAAVPTMFDLWLIPEPDRSVSIHKIVGREGGRVFYET